MPRSPCLPCVCGFADDDSLFPELTSSRVHQLLRDIRTNKGFTQFLKKQSIILVYEENEWLFPPGVCRSVQNKLRAKIDSLRITIQDCIFDLPGEENPVEIQAPQKGDLGGQRLLDFGTQKISDISLNPVVSEIELDFLTGIPAWKPGEGDLNMDIN